MQEGEVSLRYFCREHGLWDRTTHADGSRRHTHVDLSGENGGTLHVPAELYLAFMKAFAFDLSRKEPLYLCETDTTQRDVFKMLFDIDMKIAKEVRPTWQWFVRHIFRPVISDMARFYPDLDDNERSVRLRCVVLSSPDKDIGDGKIKVGYHMHFPNLVVNHSHAFALHASVSSAISRQTKVSWASSEFWAEAFDPLVYKSSGIRMVGCDKSSICPSCRNRSGRITCTVCSSKGRLAEGRPYMPLCTLNGDGSADNDYTHRLANDFEEMALATSIRSIDAQPSPGFRPYPGAPAPLPVRSTVNPKTNARTITRDSEFASDADGWRIVKHRGAKDIDDDNIYAAMQRIIASNVPVIYKDIEITCLTYADTTKKKIWARTAGCGCNYCGNVRREHTSNTIYFEITPEGIAQRCWSDKNNCRKYAGQRWPIRQIDADIMFPSKTPAEKRAREARDKICDAKNPEHEEIYISDWLQALEMTVFKDETAAADGGRSQAKPKRRGKRAKLSRKVDDPR